MTDLRKVGATVLFPEESYAIVGAAIEVHTVLGSGFLEGVYQEALELEMSARGIPFQAQKAIPVRYKGQILKHYYVADLVCYDKIIVELKALNQLSSRHFAQALNYLTATDMRLALLFNFGSKGRLERNRVTN
jgi:GxxExxY protein